MLSKNQLKLVRSLELKKNRKREHLFVAEGPKVVGDLLKAGYIPHTIFSTTPRPNAQLITDEETAIEQVVNSPAGNAYTILGQPADSSFRGGILIIDGKKVIR